MLKVLKFGGSSMADARQFEKVKSIVQADPARRVVIVSAAGKRFSDDHKLTDLLYLCHAHLKYGVSCDNVFDMIRSRYMEIRDDLGLQTDLETEFDALRRKMDKGISQDELVSRGEYFAAQLMADYLGYDFLDSELWLKFNLDGTVDQETSYEALSRAASGRRVVIPGFYGTMPDGTIKTFTRGGSDITGALAAAALNADVYENWTDVSGFLMADPRIVKNPKQIETISYKELRELSYMGASVLHEDAIYPARMANVPINIRNTNDPEDPGTMITAESQVDSDNGGGIITGIAGSKDFTVVALYKNMMSSERGFVRRILGILDDYDINFEHLPSSIDTVSVVMSKKALGDRLDEVLEAFRQRLQPDSIDVFENIALIATVGHRMTYRPGVSAKLFNALGEAKVNIRMIDQGSSEMNIIVGVENKDFEKAIRAIYDTFVEEE